MGGCQEHLNEARPVIETFTSRIVHLGASGNGQLAKAMNNCWGPNDQRLSSFISCNWHDEGESLVRKLMYGLTSPFFINHESELWKSKAGVLVYKDRGGLKIDLATGQN